jgi:hypothetical protein
MHAGSIIHDAIAAGSRINKNPPKTKRHPAHKAGIA